MAGKLWGFSELTNHGFQFGQGHWDNWHWKVSEAEGTEGVGKTPGGLEEKERRKKKNEHKVLFKSIQRSFLWALLY